MFDTIILTTLLCAARFFVLGIDAFNAAEANDMARIELGKNGKILATRRTS
jgi:hypothetical protein